MLWSDIPTVLRKDLNAGITLGICNKRHLSPHALRFTSNLSRWTAHERLLRSLISFHDTLRSFTSTMLVKDKN
ncbi:MAG: hypothetical protein EBE86_028035 [Hormoscilla sp. GUM202]|nr:hypothetical protein [Hormoscilla sp. GUM202]